MVKVFPKWVSGHPATVWRVGMVAPLGVIGVFCVVGSVAVAAPSAPPAPPPSSAAEGGASVDEGGGGEFDVDIDDQAPAGDRSGEGTREAGRGEPASGDGGAIDDGPPPPGDGEESSPPPLAPHEYDLPRLEREILARAAALEMARMREEEAEALKMLADWQYFPRISTRGVMYPSAKYRKPDTSSTEAFVTDRQPGGYFDTFGANAQIELTLPLYTFGRIEEQREAARLNRDVSRERTRRTAAEIRFMIHRAYWGYVTLRRLERVLNEAREVLARIKPKLEQLLAENSDMVSPTDRYKVVVAERDLEVQANELAERKGLLLAGLRIFLGLSADAPFEIQAAEPAPLPPLAGEAGPLRLSATDLSPEGRMLSLGERAYDALARAAFAEFLPVFFLYGAVGYTYTHDVYKTPNPFLSNPYNGATGALFIGVRLDLDIPQKLAQYRRARAVAEAFRAERRFASEQLEARWEAARLACQRRERDFDAQTRARKAGRAWMVSQLLGFEAGAASVRDLLDGVRAYLGAEAALYMSIFDLNEARLEQIRLLASPGSGGDTVPADTGAVDADP